MLLDKTITLYIKFQQKVQIRHEKKCQDSQYSVQGYQVHLKTNSHNNNK